MVEARSVGFVENMPVEKNVTIEKSAPEPHTGSTPGTATEIVRSSDAAPPLWKDYWMLTKPRVISLLLFTTWAAMIMAERGWPGMGLFLLTGIGFYMAAGSAHAMNMVIDRDIDKRTERTAKRPVASGRISSRNALIFAAVLGIGSFLILWQFTTLLAALMAWSGLAFYVVVYTLFLKRRTWSNIVIGGAAGSFPPLVGWAAVTGELAPLAWLLFGIIFLWTPVHFWALAIMIKDDYAKNGIPMLPVVRGERATSVQIIWYAILTMLLSLAPFVLRDGNSQSGMMAGWIYLVCALVLNGLLVWRSVLLLRYPGKPRASYLFHYSMLYLFLLFLALAVDRIVIRTRF
jgi:protoheme IX farnesyltransferase